MQIQSATFGNAIMTGYVCLHADAEGFSVETVYTTVPNPNVFRLIGDSDAVEEFATLHEARVRFNDNLAIGEMNAEFALARSKEVATKSADPELAIATSRLELHLAEIKAEMTEELVEDCGERCIKKYQYEGMILVFTYLECDVYVEQIVRGDVIEAWWFDFEGGFYPTPEGMFNRIFRF